MLSGHTINPHHLGNSADTLPEQHIVQLYSIARNMPRSVAKVNDDGMDASPSTSNELATGSTRQSKIQKKSNRMRC
ncbi:hypothetical protein HJC23_007144 [Cyclotella cryptica]|uniref:Uncharacterized protein n=1 Tax=Cyclotella cryptica TaxID=29204 RepID=A0ABD3QQL5_9STRA